MKAHLRKHEVFHNIVVHWKTLLSTIHWGIETVGRNI